MKRYALGFIILFLSTFAFAGQPRLSTPPTNSNGSIELTGNMPDSPFYLHEIWRNGPGSGWKIRTVSYMDTPITDIVGQSGQYNYRSRWFNPEGSNQYSGWSNTISVQVAIGGPPTTAPPSVYAPSTDSDGRYPVRWDAAPGASTYRLYQSKNGGSYRTIYSGSARQKNVVNNTSGTYRHKVKACNANGCGPYSSVKMVIVNIPNNDIPAPPSKLAVIPSAPAVYWTTPAGDNLYYELERSTYEYGGNSFVSYYSGSNTSVYLAGTNFANYKFRVRACNNIGCSAWRHSVTEE